MDDELPDDGEDFLHMVRDLPSEPSGIYAAWINLADITSWWGAEGFVVPPDRISARQDVGGDYRACIVNTLTGDELWWSGTYRILDPPREFEVTQQWKRPDGTPAGPVRVINVGLQPLPEADGSAVTRMTFREGPFSDDRVLRGHESTWNEAFTRLAGYLARQQ